MEEPERQGSGARSSPGAGSGSGSDDGEGGPEELAAPARVTGDGHRSAADAERLRQLVYERTDPVIQQFKWMFFTHSIIVEGPLSVLEALLKSLVLVAGVILMGLAFAVTRSPGFLTRTKIWARDCVLNLGAMISLIIPGCAALVYREFDPDEDWELRPIPTIVGAVDARRFFTFVWGQGSLATRLRLAETAGTSDTWGDTMALAPPQVTTVRSALGQSDEEEEEQQEMTDLASSRVDGMEDDVDSKLDKAILDELNSDVFGRKMDQQYLVTLKAIDSALDEELAAARRHPGMADPGRGALQSEYGEEEMVSLTSTAASANDDDGSDHPIEDRLSDEETRQQKKRRKRRKKKNKNKERPLTSATAPHDGGTEGTEGLGDVAMQEL